MAIKQALTDVEILLRRRRNATDYQKKFHRAVKLDGVSGRNSESNFTGPVAHKPCPPPNAMPGISAQQLMSGRASVRRRDFPTSN